MGMPDTDHQPMSSPRPPARADFALPMPSSSLGLSTLRLLYSPHGPRSVTTSPCHVLPGQPIAGHTPTARASSPEGNPPPYRLGLAPSAPGPSHAVTHPRHTYGQRSSLARHSSQRTRFVAARPVAVVELAQGHHTHPGVGKQLNLPSPTHPLGVDDRRDNIPILSSQTCHTC
jgi:hypothetical protein